MCVSGSTTRRGNAFYLAPRSLNQRVLLLIIKVSSLLYVQTSVYRQTLAIRLRWLAFRSEFRVALTLPSEEHATRGVVQ